MKKTGLFLLCFLSLAVSCYAQEAPKKAAAKKAKKAAPQVVVATPVAAPQPSALELEAGAKEQLNKKEWQITFVPIGNPKARPQTDTLTFYGSSVSSKRFAAKGFSGSNYTIRALPDGTFTWETMQKNGSDDVVFWKGGLQGEVMTGVLSFHPKKGGNEDFSFSSNNSR